MRKLEMGGAARFVLAPCARAYPWGRRRGEEDAASEGGELPLEEFGSGEARWVRWRRGEGCGGGGEVGLRRSGFAYLSRGFGPNKKCPFRGTRSHM